MQSKFGLKFRLTVMNFLEFAVWGAYLTSMGRYLGSIGMSGEIGWFYSIQGIVSIFMPALMGVVADRWIPAQRLLGLCHLLAACFMGAAAWYGFRNGPSTEFFTLFSLYALSVAFYMPTLALSNSVAYTGLHSFGLDTVKEFPAIRVFGTVGFIVTMWAVDLMGFQANQNQFFMSAVLSALLFVYTFALPHCPVSRGSEHRKSLSEVLGLQAFALFKQRKMALFFIFSMLLGVSLQITNGFANPFINSFGYYPEYADTYGVNHANILISLSQMSETLCILLIPFFMKRFGIKNVMMIAMAAWVLRFGLFGVGNPGEGVWMFVLSMIVYGVAFDFFNVSGSLFVDANTDAGIRSSAQGLFMLMTNGVGATIGTLAAQQVINYFTHGVADAAGYFFTIGDWTSCWFIFASYSLIVLVLFALLFKTK